MFYVSYMYIVVKSIVIPGEDGFKSSVAEMLAEA